MNTLSTPSSPAVLLHEADARMTQALANFFQRSRIPIRDTILRAIAKEMTPSAMATSQTCLDWLNAYPDALSTAFADQFRLHLAQPETFSQRHDIRPAVLQLLDDAALQRQLAEEKAAAQLTEVLLPEMLLLFARLHAVRLAALENPEHADAYAPLPVMRALSRAFDSLGIAPQSGTILLECTTGSLLDTLKHTYAALNQFLDAQGIEADTAAGAASPPPPRRAEAGVGQEILAHIRSVTAHACETALMGSAPFMAEPSSFIDSLPDWQALPQRSFDAQPGQAGLVLRQLQQDAHRTHAGAFDLAVLDAVAGLFEFILDDQSVPTSYKAEIAHLQIPALRVALTSPDFFSDDRHPARQLIDLLGLFSRRFPEASSSHVPALEQIQATCASILGDPGDAAEAFAHARSELAAWLENEDAGTAARLASEVAQLEHIERQELGTLLALENLHDLTERYPAPESVLRRLEAAWVPHMTSLYVAEAGEGPNWRAACMTLLQLFLSLQIPDSDATREARLQSIPRINAELRRGLLAQGAAPAQLKDFFSAITATQECWVRPAVGQQQALVSTFVPQRVSPEEIAALAHRLADSPAQDFILQQAQQLREGDWVDFDPPFGGLTTARVAWGGVHGYLLFCDGEGKQHFSFDCDRLAVEIRAGRAHIPEQSLTRKAMLRLKTQLSAAAR